jgi:hypothetical protein
MTSKYVYKSKRNLFFKSNNLENFYYYFFINIESLINNFNL